MRTTTLFSALCKVKGEMENCVSRRHGNGAIFLQKDIEAVKYQKWMKVYLKLKAKVNARLLEIEPPRVKTAPRTIEEAIRKELKTTVDFIARLEEERKIKAGQREKHDDRIFNLALERNLLISRLKLFLVSFLEKEKDSPLSGRAKILLQEIADQGIV